MKKIPTLFERVFDNHRIVGIKPIVKKGCESVLNGECVTTIKWDGAACAIIGGELYKRYDAKKGKPIPDGAIKCQDEPDPVTGHMPCWVKCDRENPADKWFFAAYDACPADRADGTYEAIGLHFNGNPYRMSADEIVKHGIHEIAVQLTFDGIREYLLHHHMEGIVFWKDGAPLCKIKRTDFGFEWNGKK